MQRKMQKEEGTRINTSVQNKDTVSVQAKKVGMLFM